MKSERPIISLLYHLISGQITENGKAWVDTQIERFENASLDRRFFLAFSAVPRYTGKQLLSVSPEDQQKAHQIREGLDISTWTLDQACRIMFLMYLPDEAGLHKKWVDDIFDTADMGELTALFKALPLFPHPANYSLLAAEGVRTNMLTVLESIVLHNPYPADHLDPGAWNQVFLKSAFTDRPIYKIVGVDRRANAELARIVSDYAHERWAAGRPVSAELWRVVPSFMDDQIWEDIKKLFEMEDEFQQIAAALVCLSVNNDKGRELLNEYPQLAAKVKENGWDWDSLGMEIERQKLNT